MWSNKGALLDLSMIIDFIYSVIKLQKIITKRICPF